MPRRSTSETPTLLERGLAQIGRQSPGRALPAELHEQMSARIGARFDGVRIHDDARAHTLTRSVGANALTIGRDIHFAAGRFEPDSARGEQLLAHELAHVAQRGGAPTDHVDGDLAMSLPVPLGGFEIDMADVTAAAGGNAGMQGTISFLPDPSAPYSAEIELLQIVNTTDAGGTTAPAGSPMDWSQDGAGQEAGRNLAMTTGRETAPRGWFVDNIYDPATHAPSSATGPYYQNIFGFGGGNEPGWIRSPTDIKPSTLWDGPGTPHPAIDFDFETVAKGADNQTVYGSLSWGFKVRAGLPTDEYATASGAASATVDEALGRFRTYFTHEPTTIYFDFDVDTPMAGEDAKLREFIPYVTAHPDVQLEVVGFADETGGSGYNRGLSQRRANNVASMIEGLGVDRSRITTARRGETHEFGGGAPGSGPFAAQPGQPAETAGTLRANRRVMINFVRTATTPPAL